MCSLKINCRGKWRFYNSTICTFHKNFVFIRVYLTFFKITKGMQHHFTGYNQKCVGCDEFSTIFWFLVHSLFKNLFTFCGRDAYNTNNAVGEKVKMRSWYPFVRLRRTANECYNIKWLIHVMKAWSNVLLFQIFI